MSDTVTKKILSIYFKSQIRHGIKDLEAYTKKIEKYLDSEKYRIEEAHEKNYNKPEEAGNKDESLDLLKSISMRLGYDRHIEIFTKSAIISIYSFLEFTLDDFCKKIHEIFKEKISPKDISGSGIFRSKTYLSKILEINFENLNHEWQEITILNEIRNFLVHSNGVSQNEETKSKIQKIIKKTPDINLEQEHIEISTSYIEHILSVIDCFLTEISNQYFKEPV